MRAFCCLKDADHQIQNEQDRNSINSLLEKI